MWFQAGTRVGVQKLSTNKRYKLADVQLLDSRTGRVMPKTDSLYEMVQVSDTVYPPLPRRPLAFL